MLFKIIKNCNVGHILLGDGWFLNSVENENVGHIIQGDGWFLKSLEILMLYCILGDGWFFKTSFLNIFSKGVFKKCKVCVFIFP